MNIGPRQQAILTSVLKNAGKFWPGCGIVWENFSTTRIILDSLVARNLLTSDGNYRYSITDCGKRVGEPFSYGKERVEEM